jgi:hypothetical protein
VKPRLIVLLALVAFTAALIGAFVGRQLFPGPPVAGVELHEVLHRKLDLDDAQLAMGRRSRRRSINLTGRWGNSRRKRSGIFLRCARFSGRTRPRPSIGRWSMRLPTILGESGCGGPQGVF